MTSHDVVIRGGTVVDGTGSAARAADVAIDDGRITHIGSVDAGGREELDALCAAVEQLQATVAAKPAVNGKAKTKARTAASA